MEVGAGVGGISRDPPDRQTDRQSGGLDWAGLRFSFLGQGYCPQPRLPLPTILGITPQDAHLSPPPVLLTSIFLHIPWKVSSLLFPHLQHWLTLEMPPPRKTQIAKLDVLQPCLCGLV